MTGKLCGAEVWSGFTSHVCGNPARFEVNGKPYCGIHNPNKKETKAQKEARIRAERTKVQWWLNRECIELVTRLAAEGNAACAAIIEARDEKLRAIEAEELAEEGQ